MMELRPVWAEVDLDALRANVRLLRAHVAPASLMAVVKADGYGHGAVACARAAVEAGAAMLGVALVEEGVALREAGIDAPILVLSEPVAAAADTVVAHRLVPTVYTNRGIEALAKAVVAAGASPLDVHLKVDTGMHRVGCSPTAAVELASTIAAHDELRLDGVLTHLAVADELDHRYNDRQLAAFDDVLDALRERSLSPRLVHAANSAGALVLADARYDMVRCGIAVYGVAPAPDLADLVPLQPVLAVKARVSFVQRLEADEAVSYGLRYRLPRDAWVATVPIGYADGIPRNLGERGGEVLVGGRRCRIAGAVTMDQLMVDTGDVRPAPGDEVVLLGRQGDEQITAQEIAQRLGTIAYEVVCGIGPRVPRRALHESSGG
jgi:alanine racemase